jgi:hypothetical protein
MKTLRRILYSWLILSFTGTLIIPPDLHAQSSSNGPTNLLFHLPKAGVRVNLSPAFTPVLIKGLKVHPENPFMFDFIVDPGQEKLNAEDFNKTSQRMVNYFLASLAIPEKDLWVNLSPVEKDRIIPDSLIKTELGRDLLAEDYMLKQVGASLIYPESHLGKTFWRKVYDEAYQKFGVTEIPVNVFNKIWIVPEKASVYEHGNTVYIVNAHLKVMLEEDLLAQNKLGQRSKDTESHVPLKELSKKVLREVVIPALEKEVNEDKNFAQLRQIFYPLILAQWYQDVFKESIMNKDYSGRKKIAGIDLSDPRNKDLIYRQYLAAYRKGVFSYIKEETDRLTRESVPRKYFSGGFAEQKVRREPASVGETDLAMTSVTTDLALNVVLNPSNQAESRLNWNDLNRPLGLLKELKGLMTDGKFVRNNLYRFIDAYSAQVAGQKFYPVQAAWPVLKAVTLLSKSEEADLVQALEEKYPIQGRPELVDKILLMNNRFDRNTWLKARTPHLVGRTIYLLAAEIHHWAGGLGPVMKFHGKGMRDLGADVKYIEARYQYSINGTVEKSRFSEIGANGETILYQLLEKGLVQEVSPTEVKPNTRRIVQKYQVEKAGLNWNDVAQKLRNNGWAEQISPTEIQLTANVESERSRISEVFDKDFLKIFPLLQRSQNVLTERSLMDIAKDETVNLWDILQHPLDYKDSNIGMKKLKEDVDHFVLEMGDINGKGTVAKQGFSDDPAIAGQIWGKLIENGYIDPRGEIQSVKFGELKSSSDMVLPETSETDKKRVYDILQRVQSGRIRQVWVEVATAVDENNIPTYLFRDVQADGISSYYTKMLYNYKGRENPVGKEESMAFINTASAELLKRLETKRKQEQDNWKPAVVHTNDGQFAPMQAVTMSRYGSDDAIKNIFWAFTTHTYRNRGGNRDVSWAINVFLKHMMGIKDRFINAFRQLGYIDYTSPGVRLSDWAGAVSDKQRDDMSPLDPNSNLDAVTNGAVPEEMASIFREEFNKLKKAGAIPDTADFERPTAREDALVKVEGKKRLNKARIRTAKGDYVQVDLDKPLIGYDRRLVIEKAGRGDPNNPNEQARAFSDDNIWMLVKLGYNVVLMGNHQGTEESEKLAAGLRDLEKKIAEEKKSERAALYPGKFQFVESFTAQQKKVFLAAADVQIQDSDNHTGAAEFSEEDITANGGLEGGPTYREGVIVDQGIPIDFDQPGKGNTLIPREDTAKSWLETVYIPLMALWNKSPEHTEFYENAALSPRLNRIQRYLITSASYLKEYDNVLDRQQQEARMDHDIQARIAQALEKNQDTIKGILYDGRNGVQKPFEFLVWDQGYFASKGKGLVPFIEKKNELENNFGYDAFLHHYLDSHFQGYLKELFNGTGPAAEILNGWINHLEDDTVPSSQERAIRLGTFVAGLAAEIKTQLPQKASAAMVVPGGIKFDHIDLARQGDLMSGIITDRSLENVLMNARGLYGVIVGITPIPDLMNFIQ